jgi:hypothetical protein
MTVYYASILKNIISFTINSDLYLLQTICLKDYFQWRNVHPFRLHNVLLFHALTINFWNMRLGFK